MCRINTKKSIALTKNEKTVIKWVMTSGSDFALAVDQDTELTRGEFDYSLNKLANKRLVEKVKNSTSNKRILWKYRVNASKLDRIHKGLAAAEPTPQKKHGELRDLVNKAALIDDDDSRCVLWTGRHDKSGRPMYGATHAGWAVLQVSDPDSVEAEYTKRVRMDNSCDNQSCISKNHLIPVMGANKYGVKRAKEELKNRDITAALSMPWVNRPSILA